VNYQIAGQVPEAETRSRGPEPAYGCEQKSYGDERALDATVMDVTVHANCRTGQLGMAGRGRVRTRPGAGIAAMRLNPLSLVGFPYKQLRHYAPSH
jgi:hypothetical protein